MQLNNPERDDRAVIVNEKDGFINIQIFCEAGLITSVLLDTTEVMGIQTSLKWASEACTQQQRNR